MFRLVLPLVLGIRLVSRKAYNTIQEAEAALEKLPVGFIVAEDEEASGCLITPFGEETDDPKQK
jgi:hypothetical protein